MITFVIVSKRQQHKEIDGHHKEDDVFVVVMIMKNRTDNNKAMKAYTSKKYKLVVLSVVMMMQHTYNPPVVSFLIDKALYLYEDTAQKTIANSNYNALETNLRYVGRNSNFLLSYTYSKSIDQSSNLGEQLDPLNLAFTRAISAFDLRHNFVASYHYNLPFDRLFHRSDRLTQGWAISGTTRFSTGFPVTLFDDSIIRSWVPSATA